nr:ATP-binding protein [Cupriavidus sp. SW-Y-13]
MPNDSSGRPQRPALRPVPVRRAASRRRVRAVRSPGADAPARGAARQPGAGDPAIARFEALAHELHDSIAQQLGFLSFQARHVEGLLARPAEASASLRELRSVLGRVQKQVRELILGARVGMQGSSLRTAVGDAVAEFSRRSSIVFELDNRLDEGHVAPACELHLLQIVREALANVVRHSRARSARVALRGRGSGGAQIVIEDDGIGVPAAVLAASVDGGEAGHYGLAIMRERARTIGAALSVETAPGGGTRIVLHLPDGEGSP